MDELSKEYQDSIDRIKKEVREDMLPYFDEDDFYYYFKKNGYDVDQTIYEMLIIKSEDSTVQVSGLTTQDTSSYFKRLASRYRRRNTGNLV